MYTAPTGYLPSFCMHVANVGSSDATVTMKHARSGTDTEIIKDANVPTNDAFVPLSGKLV